jgi:uncharacterized protein YeaO (DUF488 family)
MIKVKNLFDTAEKDDGARLWCESENLTKDLQEWCEVDHVLCNAAPSAKLLHWFEQHSDGYDYFRAKYHGQLSESKYLSSLEQLAHSAKNENFTLLHTGDNPSENAASALAEFLMELQGWAERK